MLYLFKRLNIACECFLRNIIMRILLVEPNYKNKYPPLGLMKISTYHKNRGDYVQFIKGIVATNETWDRIYITTLFTFDYNEVIKTIKYYSFKVQSINDIYVGGILASLMPDKIKSTTGIINLHVGTLTNSNIIGYSDNINIDLLPLDYSILHDTDYEYPAGDNFFGYTTRGCINNCDFCAVPKLEPKFAYTNNIVEQISTARANYGDKKDLLLLDNNILGMPFSKIEQLVNDLLLLGFTKTPSYVAPLDFEKYVNIALSLEREKKQSLKFTSKVWSLILNLKDSKKMSSKNIEILDNILYDINNNYDDVFDGILENYDALYSLFDKYTQRRLRPRYIDFNQGLDAREMIKDPRKVELLSRLPIKPFRIAFDSIECKNIYTEAVRLAYQYGIRDFSNYLLYNFEDKPEDLYERLKINIELASELDCDIYSFPMKFAPITDIDRKFIGVNWSRHFIASFRAILNVTKGVVPRGSEFFYRAYGATYEEFYKILHMPKDFIIYRNDFEKLGYTSQWTKLYNELSPKERLEVLEHQYKKSVDTSMLNKTQTQFLEFYYISYKKLSDGDKHLIQIKEHYSA